MTDRSCLTYWFPRLLAAGIPVPKTEIVDAGEDWRNLLGYFDNPKQHPGEFVKAEAVMKPLAANLRQAAARIGPAPYFLRTGQGSGKHRWKDCCDLRDLDAIENHILALVEWSEMVDMMGLPWRFWVVRERLPVKSIAILPGYGDMPLVREIRCFVNGGKILCHHAYWPRDSIRDGLSKKLSHGWDEDNVDGGRELEADDLYLASQMDVDAEYGALHNARRVAKVFADDGYWSVDVLETERGMFVTDMAVGERSFHWPECYAKKT